MAQVVSWSGGPEGDEIVRMAVEQLRQGRIVAFPTETVYGLAVPAKHADGVTRLVRGKQRPAEKPLALAVEDLDQARAWVGALAPLAERLAVRAWPGPLTLVFDAVDSEKTRELPESIRHMLCPGGTLGIRVPEHSAILNAIRLMGEPLALTSANVSGQPSAVTAREVEEAMGEEIALIIDGGPCPLAKPSTVMRIRDNTWTMLREGALTLHEVQVLAARLILFVCSGNTCRSPMAEGLAKKILAERFNCGIDQLHEHGIVTLSAGLAAIPHMAATSGAVEAAKEFGVDLSQHRSLAVSHDLLDKADDVIVMTRSHLALLEHTSAADKARLLRQDGCDMDDPYGGDEATYRDCARAIEAELRSWLPTLEGPSYMVQEMDRGGQRENRSGQ